MKRFLAGFLAGVLALALLLSCTRLFYPDTMEVSAVKSQGEYQYLLTLVTSTGFEYHCRTLAEDWHVGDLASVIVYSHGTRLVYDDTVVVARYSGYWIEH